MGLFNRTARTERERVEPRLVQPLAASPENPSTSLSNPDAWLYDWATGGAQNFGPPVSERSAMAVSAAFRCVTLLAGLIAGTPLKIYQDAPNGGRQEAPDHRLTDMFATLPHPDHTLTSFAWREMWGINLYLWGNHYSVMRRDGAGRVRGFEPAYPWNTDVYRSVATNRWVYQVTWPDGTRELFDQENVLHIVGVGFDGVKGMSRIQAFARNAIALGKVLEETVGRAHENAATPSSMVELPPNISPAGKRQIEAYYNESAAGRLNRGKILFVDKDTKYTQLQLSQEDLNTIEFRRYQAADICRFFGVPPHLIGEAAGTSAWGSGIEQLTLGFLRFTLEAEFQRIESELNAKLFAGTPFYARFDREALQAMDALAAAQTAAAEIGSGQLLINEARRRKHRPPVEGGDQPLVNSTMIPLARALNPPQPVAPAPPKESANATP